MPQPHARIHRVPDPAELRAEYEQIVEHSRNVIITTVGNTIVAANPAARRKLCGDAGADILGSSIASFFHEDYRPYIAEYMAGAGQDGRDWEPVKMRRHDGNSLDLEMLFIPSRWGANPAVILLGEDITGVKESGEHIRHLHHHDATTGLPNEFLFRQRLANELRRAAKAGRMLGVALIAADGRPRNSALPGDRLCDNAIKELGKRLMSVAEQDYPVGRLGTDRFAAIIPQAHNRSSAIAQTELLRGALNVPITSNGKTVTPSAKTGISLFPADDVTGDGLIAKAETALAHALRHGKNECVLYLPRMGREHLDQAKLESELSEAVSNGQFVPFFQPKVEAVTGHLVGAEILMRWLHPQRGIVPPVQFISPLEDNGLIEPATMTLVRTVSGHIHDWRQAGLPVVPLAINLSAEMLRNPDFGRILNGIVKSKSVDPGLIDLEVTESALITETDSAITHMRDMVGRGFTFSLDDFGTGYSSLRYLSQLPVSTLKIDKSFIDNIAETGEAMAIVEGIVGLAHQLGLKTIAEGVETLPQLEALQQIGCDQIQGYFVSRPVDADAFTGALNVPGSLFPQGPAPQ